MSGPVHAHCCNNTAKLTGEYISALRLQRASKGTRAQPFMLPFVRELSPAAAAAAAASYCRIGSAPV
jgi:hypothetical protein